MKEVTSVSRHMNAKNRSVVRGAGALPIGEFARAVVVAVSTLAMCTVATAQQAPQPQSPQSATAKAAPKAPAKAAAKSKTEPKDGAQDGAAETADAKAKVPKRKDPAEAARQIDSGVKLAEAGKVEPAIQTFTAALTGGNLPAPVMARALHQRGVAYRKAGKPAMAIHDLTNALWLKGGLSDADRGDASAQRAAAYREAGLPDQSNEQGRPAGATVAVGTRTAPAAAAPAATATVASLAPQAAPAPAAGGAGNFLSSLFGGATAAAPQAAAATPPQPVATRQATVAAPAAQPATSAWSAPAAPPAAAAVPKPVAAAKADAIMAAALKAEAAKPAPKAAVTAALPAAKTATTAPASAAPGGKHSARVASVATKAEADAVVARLRSQHAAIANDGVEITQMQFGGTALFQVRVGGYADAAKAQAVCASLKGSGLDCVPVDR